MNVIYLVALLFVLGGIALYYVLQRSKQAHSYSSERASQLALRVAPVLFVAAIISFVWRPDPYVKPTLYYVLMALTATTLFVVAVAAKSRWATGVVIGIAVLMGVTHIWTEHLLFPDSLIGLDPWSHMRIASDEIGNTDRYNINPVGAKTIGGYYSLMHLYLRTMMDLTDLSYKWASLVFIGTPQVIGITVLSYLTGRELAGKVAGLVAALLIANAGWVLFFGMWIIPNGTGPVLALFAAYGYLLYRRRRKLRFAWVAIAALSVAFLTHSLSSVWVIGLILCFGAASLIESRTSLRDCTRCAIIPIAALVLLAGWWGFTTNGDAISSTASAMQTQYPSPVTSSPVETTKPTDSHLQSTPVTEYLHQPRNTPELMLGALGALLYFGLAIPGALFMLRLSWYHRAWIVACVGTALIGLIPSLFGIVVLEDRWRYLAQVLSVIPLAITLATMRTSTIMIIRWGAVSGVAAIVFFAAIGLPANNTNRSLTPNLVVRYAFTQDEMTGFTTAITYNPSSLGSDAPYTAFIRADADWHYSGRVTSIDSAILSGDFSSTPDFILLRDALHREPFAYGSGFIYRIRYNPAEQAVKQGYTEVWSNGAVSLLRRSGP